MNQGRLMKATAYPRDMSTVSLAKPRLTPEMVQSVSFRTARLGRRGLDEEHVRAFCRQVEAELVLLLSERAALQEEAARLRRRVLGMSGDSPAAGHREDAHIQAVGILSRAQQTADHYVAEAQEYSRHLTEDARRRRDEILAQARSHADRVLAEAHHEATRAAHDAMAAPGPAAGGDRQEAQAELAYLRSYSDVYRTHLRAYLDALLRTVDEWEHAEKASLPSPWPGVAHRTGHIQTSS
jgi:DivIVA domain-containing protein